MITTYIEPTDNKPKFGIMWSLFDNMQVCCFENTYVNKATAQHQLDIHKAWIVLSNFEAVRRYFEMWFPQEDIQQHHKETVNALRASLQFMITNQENYDIILQTVMEKSEFIKNIVKETPDKYKQPMRMMAITLVQYCKNEVNERQKDKAKG